MIYLFSSILHTIFSKPMSSILISPFISIISFCNIFIYIHFYHATSSSKKNLKDEEEATKDQIVKK